MSLALIQTFRIVVGVYTSCKHQYNRQERYLQYYTGGPIPIHPRSINRQPVTILSV